MTMQRYTNCTQSSGPNGTPIHPHISMLRCSKTFKPTPTDLLKEPTDKKIRKSNCLKMKI